MIFRWAYHLPLLSVVASTCLPGEELVDGVFLGRGLGATIHGPHSLLAAVAADLVDMPAT